MDEYENTKLFLCNVFQIPPDYQIPSQVSFQVKDKHFGGKFGL